MSLVDSWKQRTPVIAENIDAEAVRQLMHYISTFEPEIATVAAKYLHLLNPRHTLMLIYELTGRDSCLLIKSK